jgi:hypothetical protein
VSDVQRVEAAVGKNHALAIALVLSKPQLQIVARKYFG